MRSSILALILLSLSSFSFDSNATEPMQYQVKQEIIHYKIAPSSGLYKADCKAYNTKGERIAAQIVTLDKENLDQGLYIVEFNLYHEQHNAIVKVECK